MKRANAGPSNVWALRQCLEKQFETAVKKLQRYDFSHEKPYFEITLRVDANDFAATVMEHEIEVLQKKLDRANKKIEELKEERDNPPDLGAITEKIYEFGDDVVSHQWRGGEHRLVLCERKLPQPTSDWVKMEQTCVIGNYSATWDDVQKIPF